MPSQVWERDPQEAFENPYEYDVQAQFDREASTLLDRLYKLLQRARFTGDDKSVEKAIWLLHVDALDTLDDALDALSRKRHRPVGRSFRDVLEAVDLAAFFHSRTDRAVRQLAKWYRGDLVMHREYRQFVQKTEGERAAQESRDQHRHLSMYTHRAHKVLLQGYSLGDDERLVHDRYASTISDSPEVRHMLVLPQTIAEYYASTARMIMIVVRELSARGSLSFSEVQSAIIDSLETETVPRRFMPREWLHQAVREWRENRAHSDSRDLESGRDQSCE